MFGISTAHRANRPIRTGAVIGLALSAAMLARAGEGGQQAASPPPEPVRSGAAVRLRRSAAAGAAGRYARDGSGRVTVRAVRLAAPLRIDGQLDEALYTSVPPISDFIQIEPAGWRAGDREDRGLGGLRRRPRLRLASRCWDSHPERHGRQRDAARQQQHLPENDARRRSCSTPSTTGATASISPSTPIGGRTDGQITNERQYNGDWNPIWDLEVGALRGRLDGRGRDPVQVAPLPAGPGADLGLQRRAASTVEERAVVPHARAAGDAGPAGFMQCLVAPRRWSASRRRPASRTSRSSRTPSRTLTSDRAATPPISNDLGGDVGVDVKYGITQNLTADLTYNTDFAQVEADEQQVNLTRFSLFFPEKREFFLENQGTFAFGGASAATASRRTRRHAGAVLQPPHRPERRRRPWTVVPIDGGGRLTGGSAATASAC